MKVNVIIGGGQKCGTTALHFYLSKHPLVLSSSIKELDFFNYDANYNKGFDYYHSFFKTSFFNKIIGREKFYLEASPSYLFDETPSVTAKRIYDYNKNCKLIFSVRNPIDRAYSAFEMYKKSFYSEKNRDMWYNWVKKRKPEILDRVTRRTNADFESFKVFVENELNAIVNDRIIEFNTLNLGHYHTGISAFKEFFNPLVISQEEMNSTFLDTMEKISDFIGLSKYDWSKLQSTKVFENKYNKNIDEETRLILDKYYKESNIMLYNMTGIKYFN